MHKSIQLGFILLIVASYVQAQVVTMPDSTLKEDQSFFPLMRAFKAKAVKAGAVFPKPYGISGSMYYQQQQMDINKIQLGEIEISEDGGIIDFEDSKIRNTVTTTQLRADVWLLPFVNIYGMAGRVNTFNDIDLKINLNPPPGSPDLGDIELLKQRSIANVNGTVAAVGTVVAGGYGKVFVNVNLTWAQTWLKEVNSTQKAFVAFPMAGLTTKFANLFVGGIYQNTGQTNKGSFTNTNGETVKYELQFTASRWNYVVGLNKSIGSWSIVMSQGFGKRTSSIIEVGYRFGN